MSGTIMLFCWEIDTPTKQAFAVRVGHDDIWGSVKDAIKKKMEPEFNDIASSALDLWKVRYCPISHVVARLSIQKVTIHRYVSGLDLIKRPFYIFSTNSHWHS
jgi:Ni,Fe-hydrogenase I small subunit